MAEEFQDIIAVTEGKRHWFVNLYKTESDNYAVWCNITLYGVPEELSEEKENEIYNGNFEQAIHIGELIGCLILCKQMFEAGQDPYTVCDDISGELEFVMSALQEENGPLNDEIHDDYQDVFYIEELQLKSKYKTQKLSVSILNSVPDMIFSLYHVYPNILCYYPRPLPYEENIHMYCQP